MARNFVKTGFIMAAVVAGAVQPVMAWIGGGMTASKQSQQPCAYSLLLQQSAEERGSYIARVAEYMYAASLGGVNSVERLYGDITPASVSYDDSPSVYGLNGFNSVPKKSTRLDSFSTDCITCHDGASALLVSANYRDNPHGRLRRHVGGSDHPIGMDYAGYVAANPGKYKPLSQLDSRMVFVEGKVGCLTCHNPLNPERNHLVMSDRRSALCLTCHDK